MSEADALNILKISLGILAMIIVSGLGIAVGDNYSFKNRQPTKPLTREQIQELRPITKFTLGCLVFLFVIILLNVTAAYSIFKLMQ